MKWKYFQILIDFPFAEKEACRAGGHPGPPAAAAGGPGAARRLPPPTQTGAGERQAEAD